IGRTFAEAFLKSYRSRELDAGAATPWQALAEVPEDVHPFFQLELAEIRGALDALGDVDALVAGDWLRLKRLGLSDPDIAAAARRQPAIDRASSSSARARTGSARGSSSTTAASMRSRRTASSATRR